jgi:O-antigen ligase
MIRDHPFLGVGMDNFLYHYRGGYLRPEAAAEPNLSHPHNLLLNFWLQMGILGLVAVGWLLGSLGLIWRRLWRLPQAPEDRALLAGLAGAAVDLVAHGLVDNSYFLVDLAFHFWLSAALLVSLARQPATDDSSAGIG